MYIEKFGSYDKWRVAKIQQAYIFEFSIIFTIYFNILSLLLITLIIFNNIKTFYKIKTKMIPNIY